MRLFSKSLLLVSIFIASEAYSQNLSGLEPNITLDRSCQNKGKTEAQVQATFARALQRGLSCMLQTNSNTAQTIMKSFSDLFSKNGKPFTISCSQLDFSQNQNSIFARAFSAEEKKFPGLALNPTTPLGDSVALQGTLFHETLHTIGFHHGTSVEIPHACDTCCFNYGYSLVKSDTKAAACRICQGTYNIQSAPYLNDLYKLVESTYSPDLEKIWQVNAKTFIRAEPRDFKRYLQILKFDGLSRKGLPDPIVAGGIVQFLRERLSTVDDETKRKLAELESFTVQLSTTEKDFGLHILNFYYYVQIHDMAGVRQSSERVKNNPIFPSVNSAAGYRKSAIYRLYVQGASQILSPK